MSARSGVAQASHRPSAPVLPTDWQDRAQCRTSRVDFHAESVSGIERAKWVCHSCPVTQACLEYALARGEKEGVWGGLDADERARLQRRQVRARRRATETPAGVVVECRRCKQDFEAPSHRNWYCPPCRITVRAEVLAKHKASGPTRTLSRVKDEGAV